MDGLGSTTWTGTECDPPVGFAAPSQPAEASALHHAWLDALPHAAAILDPSRPNEAALVRGNTLFHRHFVDRAAGSDAWDKRLLEELARYAASGRATGSFTIERPTPLGVEQFACTLSGLRDGIPGQPDAVLLTAIDRTTDHRVEASLRRELVSDPLTALPNRAGFGEAAEQLIARNRSAERGDVAILILDLMRFSRINEALGTIAGDELILTVASRLTGIAGEDMILGRIGGNEFAICARVPHGLGETVALAERMKATVATPIRLADLQISIDCAIGCALARLTQADTEELIRQAQAAARIAKRTDRLEFHRHGELKAARERFMMESRLRDALTNGGLHLVYQPIVDLGTSQVTGFEALARWDDADIGPIAPTDFISVAEDSGLVVPLGRWALHEAMSQLTRWDERLGATMPIKMNVNLSPIQMARDDVISTIQNALRVSGVEGPRLMIELTESAIVADPEACRNLLAALKRSNVAIAMDDFGTGYSNMASLQTMPIDVLKIDRSFVNGMLGDHDKTAIIRAILSLTDALGMHATAEGVESAEVATALRDMGCRYAQGYFFARPMPADEAFDYWRERRNSVAI